MQKISALAQFFIAFYFNITRAFGSESAVIKGFLIKYWARGLSFEYVGHWPHKSLTTEIQPSPSTPYIRPRGILRDNLRHSFFFFFFFRTPQGVDSLFARSYGTTDDMFKISPLYCTPFNNYVAQPNLKDIIVLFGIPGSCPSEPLDFDQI